MTVHYETGSYHNLCSREFWEGPWPILDDEEELEQDGDFAPSPAGEVAGVAISTSRQGGGPDKRDCHEPI